MNNTCVKAGEWIINGHTVIHESHNVWTVRPTAHRHIVFIGYTLRQCRKWLAQQPTHSVVVAWVPINHGYPYRATCECGWKSNTYAAKHAAQAMGDDHVKNS